MRKQKRLSEILSKSTAVEKEYVKINSHPKTDVEMANNMIDRLTTRERVKYPGEKHILLPFYYV